MENRIKDVKNYSDFRKVFEVFKDKPFYENWIDDEMLKEYEFLKQYGEIYGYYIDDTKIVGLVSIIYGSIKEHPVKFLNPEKTIYLSDIAVVSDERGKGYAKKLADFIIEYAELFDYYDEMYLRTNLTGSMSEKIFLARGFEIMKDENNKIITQDVSFERTNGLIEKDTRKFLSKRLVLK